MEASKMNKSFLIFIVLFVNQCFGKAGFTPLEIDNHPCTPERLKSTTSYICDHKGTVICQAGWKQPENLKEATRNPCSEPICNHDNLGCLHGVCRSPNFCACEVGWEGLNCEICVPLPGCAHGNCTLELECNCFQGWSGSKCDIPECVGCHHGECLKPNECNCYQGWTGKNCSSCIAMPGCKNGHCGNTPNTCVCDEGWEGVLCDQPVCDPPCVHGECVESKMMADEDNFCVCENGWKSDACNQCVPYWNCPNQGNDARVKPNECICPDGVDDQTCKLNSMNKTTTLNMKGSSNTQTGSRPSIENFRGNDKTTRPPRAPVSGGRPPARPAVDGDK